MKNIIKQIIFIIVILINFNIVNSKQIILLEFNNSDCLGEPEFINSATECSNIGFIQTLNENSISRINVNSSKHCKIRNTISGNEEIIEINKCISNSDNQKSIIYQINSNSNSLLESYCNYLEYFDNSCSNFNIRSFKNNTCYQSKETNKFEKLICNSQESQVPTMLICNNCNTENNDECTIQETTTTTTTKKHKLNCETISIKKYTFKNIFSNNSNSIKQNNNNIFIYLLFLIILINLI